MHVSLGMSMHMAMYSTQNIPQTFHFICTTETVFSKDIGITSLYCEQEEDRGGKQLKQHAASTLAKQSYSRTDGL